MTTCNATLTTATVTDESIRFLVNGDVVVEPLIDGTTVKRVGDKLMRVETHTLTCERDAPHDPHFRGRLAWDDDTPGAKPHTPTPTVTEDEWVRALRAVNAPEDIIERAARRVRNAQGDR